MFEEIKLKNKELSSLFINVRDLYDKNFIKKYKSNKFT